MPLHDTVGIKCKNRKLLKIKEQMLSIWPKACMLMILCVLPDLTLLPLLGGGRKSWYIICVITISNIYIYINNLVTNIVSKMSK